MSLVITKQTGNFFSIQLNSETPIISDQNRLTTVGDFCHFKTANGANIIKEQNILYSDVTLIASGNFTFASVNALWLKLIEVGFFEGLGGGTAGSGVDRFDQLLDTFTYVGRDGQVVVVNESQQKLVTVPFANVSKFTDLSDTPSLLQANKMVTTNASGTALILADLPEPPEQFLNAAGYFIYADLATQTTPLTLSAGVPRLLTNDTLGSKTDFSQSPFGVSSVWSSVDNAFNWSQLSVGDTVDIRFDVSVTTANANQIVKGYLVIAEGTPQQEQIDIFTDNVKTAGTNSPTVFTSIPIRSEAVRTSFTKAYLITDASGSVKVNGWYCRVLRKNINIVNITTDVNHNDLNGLNIEPFLHVTTAEKANWNSKTPQSRLINTTSPLLGGGDLSANRTLSIQQATNSQDGFLSSFDWTMFNSKIGLTSLSASTPLSYNNLTGLFSIQQANTSQGGFLSSTDWNTFNSKQNALTNPVTGTGVAGQVSFWNGTSFQSGDNQFFWDNTNKRLGVGTTVPTSKLEVSGGDIKVSQTISTPSTAGNGIIFRNTFNSNIYDAQIVTRTNAGGAATAGLLFRTGYWNGTVPTQADRMYIDAETGNVGIGTLNPTNKFVISNNGVEGIEFNPTSGNISTFNRSTAAYTPLSLFSLQLDFQTGTTGGTNTIKGRLTTAGRWLFGTTTDNGTDLVQINGSAIATAWKVSGGLVTDYQTGTGTVVDFATTVRGTVLTGYTAGANTALASTDTLLVAMGKIQGQITARVTNATHTGDATGATVLTLATVNANVGSFGTASSVAQYTVNAKGLTTASANVPILIAQSQVTNLTTDLGLKAPLASPALTGTPTAPTATAGTNTTQLATTAFVASAVSTADSGNVKLIGDQNITGTKSFNASGSAIALVANNNGTGESIRVVNNSTGKGINVFNLSTSEGIIIGNTSSGRGLFIDNQAGGIGIYSRGTATSTGAVFAGGVDSSINFLVTKLGDVTANTFVKSGGTANQMLMANGSTRDYSALPTYADNAAAIAGGLAVGALYRTIIGLLAVRF
jgi:hypothetical protein